MNSSHHFIKPVPKTHEEGMTQLALLVSEFSLVHRATLLHDGVTPESDTDHTVMLSVVACSLAASLYKDELNVGLVSQFATVHDLIEAYVGDTDTFGITEEGQKKKEVKEERALQMLDEQFKYIYPWLPETVKEYESLKTKEARFVKVVDKMMTLLTHILNNGRYLIEKRIDRETAERYYASKIEKAKSSYGSEFLLIIHFMESLKDEVIHRVYGKL